MQQRLQPFVVLRRIGIEEEPSLALCKVMGLLALTHLDACLVIEQVLDVVLFVVVVSELDAEGLAWLGLGIHFALQLLGSCAIH